jgi:hypothetical protein
VYIKAPGVSLHNFLPHHPNSHHTFSFTMQLSLIFSIVLPCVALAMPAVLENESNLVARAAPKLNQYRNMDDW